MTAPLFVVLGHERSAVEGNVRATMRRVLETPERRARLREGTIRLVGAVVEIATGKVCFLEKAAVP